MLIKKMMAGFYLMLCFSLFADKNLIINGSFEKEYLGNLFLWSSWARFHNGSTVNFGISEEGAYEGTRHVVIKNPVPNGAAFFQWVRVEPRSYYVISAYIKTSGLDRGAQGACLSIVGISLFSEALDNRDGLWQPVVLKGRTGEDQHFLGIALRLGTEASFVKGVAAFDDVRCVQVTPSQQSRGEFQSFASESSVKDHIAWKADEGNLIVNKGFEWFEENLPVMWQPVVWDASESASYLGQNQEKSFAGKSSAMIQLRKLNDAMFQQWVLVKPLRTYRLSGRIWAEADESALQGAYISVLGLTTGPAALWNTEGQWQEFELYGRTGLRQRILPVITRLGDFGYGARGTAYFDEISLVEVAPDSVNSEVENFSNQAIEDLVKGEEAVGLWIDRFSLFLLMFILAACLGLSILLILFLKIRLAILNRDNLRQSTRLHLASYAEVKLPEPEGGFKILEFQVMDLSLNGVFLMSSDLSAFEIGDKLEMDIRIKGKIYPIALAEVVRKEEGVDENNFPRQQGYGVRLVIKDKVLKDILQEE